MKSIDTEYAGYRFRSRLEARWAVFFDTVGIDYQYEPEGLLLPWRLGDPNRNPFRYLPDFWLPELGLWCEVKGQWSAHERIKALNAAAALSEEGQDVLILGDVFRQPRGGSRRPWRLHFADGLLSATPWPDVDDVTEPIACDEDPQVMRDAIDLLRGYRSDDTKAPAFYLEGAKAAQQARFEFGQTPGRS